MSLSRLYLFDFDGTIANSAAVVFETFNRIGPKFGCKQIDPGILSVILLGRSHGLMKEYGLSRWKLPFIVWMLRRELKPRLDQIKAQPGILDVFRGLRADGHRVGILTSNSRFNVERFLERHQARDTVDLIVASAPLFGKHKALKKLLASEQISPEAVMHVGDEVRDIEASQRVGVKSVAVTWGFQSESILKAAKPDFIVTAPEQLRQL
jgi:phosphoglycolate phosphatase